MSVSSNDIIIPNDIAKKQRYDVSVYYKYKFDAFHFPYDSITISCFFTKQQPGLLVTMITRGQFHVRPGPEMAQISDGEVELDSHLSRHDYEAHVPT